MALASANFYTGRGYGGMCCPQFNLAFSLEEASTFDRGSSLNASRVDKLKDLTPEKRALARTQKARFLEWELQKERAPQKNTAPLGMLVN
jgi:hypothetical protein